MCLLVSESSWCSPHQKEISIISLTQYVLELLVHTLKYFCRYYSTVVVSKIVKDKVFKNIFQKETHEMTRQFGNIK